MHSRIDIKFTKCYYNLMEALAERGVSGKIFNSFCGM